MKRIYLVGLFFTLLVFALWAGSAAGEAILGEVNVDVAPMEAQPSDSPLPSPEALLPEELLDSEAPMPDEYAKARASYLKAKDIFSAIADISEGSLRKNAAAAAAAAQDAANAAQKRDEKTATEAAGRAKLDAVLASATILLHTEVDKAVKGFDTQMSAFAGAPDEEKPEQLAKVASKLVGIANALQKAIAGDT